MKQSTTKKGFTIIEVVLVLAIAGLIFMMVFIALPALQRSQRDTQRSADISRVSTALNQYQGSNRGRIPATNGGSEYVAGHRAGTSAANAGDVGTWKYFYDNYLIVKAGGAQDSFTDPDGGDYSLWITECKPAQDEVGKQCSNGQRFGVTFDSQANANLPRIAATRRRVTQFLSLLTLPAMVSSLHIQLVLAKLPSSTKKKVVASSASITS